MVRSQFLAASIVAFATSALAAEEVARPARETFVVEPFANEKNARALDYLAVGIPAIIAERLWHHGPLRFVGGPALLSAQKSSPNTPAPAKWIIGGAFERQADWKIAVKVTVRSATDESRRAEAVVVGPKDEAPSVAVKAALLALAGIPDVKLPPNGEAVLAAPFGRDPYAFVLYGRGVRLYVNAGPKKGGERAVALLKRSLIIDPKVPEVRRYLGLVHLEGFRPGHARAMWTYAVDVKPSYLPVLSALAALDRAAGLPTALERYARVVELDPEDVEARRVYGEILSEVGQLDLAEVELHKVLQATPHDLRARRALALVLAARRAGSELVIELEQLVKLDPENLEGRLDLGAAYMSVGRTADAEAVYDEVLRRRPRHPSALKLAGDLARARGDLKKAAALYGKLRMVAPQDPRPVFLLGSAHYEAGDMDAAERMFAEGSRYPGMMGDAYSNLGAIALRRGHPKEALWFLGRAAKRRPGKPSVRFNHAMALAALSRHADALNELRVAATLDPSDAGVRFFAGVIALRLGLLRDAEVSFREALRLDPAHEDARHNLALLEPLVRPRRENSLSLVEGIPMEMAPIPVVKPEGNGDDRQQAKIRP